MSDADREDAAWREPRNWRSGGFYVAPDDSRVWVPKRPPGIGWTLNFARPASWLWMTVLLAIPIVIMALTLHTVFAVAAARGR